MPTRQIIHTNTNISGQRNFSTGFYTLIELIVVTATIAILTTMFFSALEMGKRKVKDLNCMNNLGELGDAFFERSYDHNGFMPAIYKDEPGLGYAFWFGGMASYNGTGTNNILPYIQGVDVSQSGQETKAEVFNCERMWDEVLKNINPFWGNNSYGMNRNWGHQNYGGPNWETTSNHITAALSPAQTALVADGQQSLNSDKLRASVFYQWLPGTYNNQLSGVHNDGANIAFSDGHVNWVSTTDCMISGDDGIWELKK